MRMNDTILYCEAEKTLQEGKIANLTCVSPSLFGKLNEISQYLPIKETVCEKLIFPGRTDHNPADSQENTPLK